MLCVLLLSCLVVCDVVSSSSSSSSSYPHPGWNPSYYARFPNGVPSSMDYFPIGVWLQNASNAQGFKDIGINLYIGQAINPSSFELQELKNAGMPVFTTPSPDVLSFPSGVWYGPNQPDEPDDAQPDGKGGYGPCIDPNAIIAQYNAWKIIDNTRPVYLSFGPAVSIVNMTARGVCTGKTSMYYYYQQGADILSYDIYPVNNHYPITVIGDGIDNLYVWSNYSKPVWTWIEAVNFNGGAPAGHPNEQDIYAEVWHALTHNLRGFGYFCHQFVPSFIEDACLKLPLFSSAITHINAKVNALARALNSPTILQTDPNSIQVVSQTSGVLLDVLTKMNATGYYFLTVNRNQNTAGSATFKLPAHLAANATVATVLFEGRTVPIEQGTFLDKFNSYDPHTYFISTAEQ
eukprot:TRINITY_DN2948_c0_g1_i4.p1 TRINITY_DN2948_c0_g1~~TRINITY_DN2948_c0_g1_i4.p1  ORF type:complete len:404 (+),score=76.41 TRINITY_DN2948_c0_g1_i4:59-1270(+)